jgi:hypothetical protein
MKIIVELVFIAKNYINDFVLRNYVFIINKINFYKYKNLFLILY